MMLLNEDKQIVITKPVELLDKDGNLRVKGYATIQNFIYNKEMIKTKTKIKESDFYQVLNDEYCLQMTISHSFYVAKINATLISLKSGERWSIGKIKLLPNKTLSMPLNAEENHKLIYKCKKFTMSFEVKGETRYLTLTGHSHKYRSINIDIALESVNKSDKMVLAKPFNAPDQFLLSYKQNCFICSGLVKFNDHKVVFNSSNTLGLVNWQRGVYQTNNSLFWGNAATILSNGKLFGFNIGSDLVDNSCATENMLFYNYKSHKLDQVYLKKDDKNNLKPWIFTSNDNRLNLVMSPIFDNYVGKKKHQVFGYFNGEVILDDDTKLKVVNVLGFCEIVK